MKTLLLITAILLSACSTAQKQESSEKELTEIFSDLDCEDYEMARYLIQKGARPSEGIQGPLQASFQNACVELSKIYLEHMSADDIAKASLSIDLSGVIPEWEAFGVSPHFAQNLKTILNNFQKKNLQLCQESKPYNCRALIHLNHQIASFYQNRLYSLRSFACTIQASLNSFKLRKKLQLKQVQILKNELHYYLSWYYSETGRELDLNSCDRNRLHLV